MSLALRLVLSFWSMRGALLTHGLCVGRRVSPCLVASHSRVSITYNTYMYMCGCARRPGVRVAAVSVVDP